MNNYKLLIFVFYVLNACNQNQSVSNEVKFNSSDLNEKVLLGNHEVKNIPEEVIIGTQIWKTKNATITTFKNGDSIPVVINANEWYLAGKNEQPAICYYNNDPSTADEYGVIYNFYAIADPRGIGTAEWRIPNVKDIKELGLYVDTDLRREIAVIENKSLQGIDVEDFWNQLNEQYQFYCPVEFHSNLQYLSQKKYASRDMHGKFELIEVNESYSGFWTVSTVEKNLFNIIHNIGIHFNVRECWRFNYSTFDRKILGRTATSEHKSIDFNQRGMTIRLMKN